MKIGIRHRYRVPTYLLLILCLLFVTLVPSVAYSPARTLPIDPALRSLLSETGRNTLVSVIVQKASPGGEVEALVERLGGEVVRNWTIIPAFLANLSADAVEKLATSGLARWISLDAPVVQNNATIDTTKLLSQYVRAIGADRLWNAAPYIQGQGVTVAVVDSGIANHTDLFAADGSNRIVAAPYGPGDGYGHGTHIAGTIAGNGAASGGLYIGVAPKANLINVRVADSMGMATTSDVIAGLQWIHDNRAAYNIRVVNLSLNSTAQESYHTSPLDAALEILWFNGIVVVVSAGNNSSSGVMYPPANDPFVITVGATDDRGTAIITDDWLASFSAYGTTLDGFSKPDIVAPGVNIISLLAKFKCVLDKQHPGYSIDKDYFRMSGTSLSSAVVAGAVALLLQDEPYLNPDQVKFRLMATARPFGIGSGAGYLDIYAAVHGTTTATANTGTPASRLLWTGSNPVNWGSVNWGSVNWGSVNWGSVNWGSVNWGSVNWGSDYWGY